MHRPPYGNPRNSCFTYGTPYRARYAAPPFNASPLPQYANYNADNMNYENQYYPGADVNAQYGYASYPDPSFNSQPTFNPSFYNSNYPTMSPQPNAQYTHSIWSSVSLSPPPPPPLPPSSSAHPTNN